MEYPEKNSSFLFTCKENYFLNIYPADNNAESLRGYQHLVKIARTHFEAGLYESFSAYFNESRYLIQLWAAHLILEYGSPAPELEAECLEIISKYVDSSADGRIAQLQEKWLEKYESRRRSF